MAVLLNKIRGAADAFNTRERNDAVIAARARQIRQRAARSGCVLMFTSGAIPLEVS